MGEGVGLEIVKGSKQGDLSRIESNTKLLNKRYKDSLLYNKGRLKEELFLSSIVWGVILLYIVGILLVKVGGNYEDIILEQIGKVLALFILITFPYLLYIDNTIFTYILLRQVIQRYKEIFYIKSLMRLPSYELQAIYTFNTIYNEYLESLNEEEYLGKTLDKLNQKVLLSNGYRTYLYNILSISKGRVITTTDCKLLQDQEGLVLEPKLTKESLREYMKVLIEDNRFEIEYKKNKTYYDRLNESENKRLRELEEVKELVKKKEEVSDKLFKGNLDKKYDKYLEEASKSLLKSKELNVSKTKWESEEKL